MIRFLFGAILGAVLMYWFLTGEVPYRAELERWFSQAATNYKGETHRTEADRIIGAGQPKRSP